MAGVVYAVVCLKCGDLVQLQGREEATTEIICECGYTKIVLEKGDPEEPYRYSFTYPEVENWVKHGTCPFCRSTLEDMATCIVCPMTSEYKHQCPSLLYDKDYKYIMVGDTYLMPDGTTKTKKQWNDDLMKRVRKEMKLAVKE